MVFLKWYEAFFWYNQIIGLQLWYVALLAFKKASFPLQIAHHHSLQWVRWGEGARAHNPEHRLVIEPNNQAPVPIEWEKQHSSWQRKKVYPQECSTFVTASSHFLPNPPMRKRWKQQYTSSIFLIKSPLDFTSLGPHKIWLLILPPATTHFLVN